MDAYHLILTPQASEELDEIYEYVERESPQAAPRLIERILDALDSLKQFPHRNVVQDLVKANPSAPVRSLPVPPYVIYFIVLEVQRAVQVVHVRHGSRRPPRHL